MERGRWRGKEQEREREREVRPGLVHEGGRAALEHLLHQLRLHLLDTHAHTPPNEVRDAASALRGKPQTQAVPHCELELKALRGQMPPRDASNPVWGTKQGHVTEVTR